MGALPKTRISRGRRDRRRNHQKLSPITLVHCENCDTLKLPHRVCKECGMYRGHEVLEVSSV